MSRNNPHIALTSICLLALSLVFLGAAQLFQSTPRAAPSESALQSEDPIAVVKSILVNGAEKLVADQSELKVTRVTAEEQAGEAGMLLTAGDEVNTGTNAQVTILFLDAAPEKDNEVLVDSNARIRVGSIFDRYGRVLVRVKGKFDTATEKVKVDVTGTEYELVVQADGTNRIRVLEGALEVEKGSFIPSTTEEESGRVTEPIVADGAANFMRSSFEIQEKPQVKMEFIAVRGKTIRFERTFVFANRCHQKHLFEIRAPRNLEWFQLMGADNFELQPGASSSISFAMKADATRVPVGVYEGEIIARCLECAQEQGCQMAGLLLPISVSVIADRTGTPVGTPSPRVEQRRTAARKLQEVILTADGTLVRNSASTDQVDQTLNWSNNVIVAGQPTYSAQSIVPHFQSPEERNRQFREARRAAILTDDPRSYEILGNIYVDWGNGAKAVDGLKKAESALQQAPQRLTTLGEAYRLTGKLPEAEDTLLQTVQLYPQYAPGFNALGNVYLDRAKIVQDRRDYERAKADLERAKDNYARAFEIRSQSPSQPEQAKLPQKPVPSLKAKMPESTKKNHHRPGHKSVGQWRSLAQPEASRVLVQQPAARANDLVKVVSQSNLAEVNLRRGDIAREQGRIDDALTQYKAAEQAFTQAEGMSGSYAFATKGLGDVYRGIRTVAVIQLDPARASEAFARSQQKYSQALGMHRDLAEAYVGLGNLYEDAGRREEAVRAYRQATRVRPEAPLAYYHLAIVLADSDPRLAAVYARAYLKLERDVFKQGDKASNARRVTEYLKPDRTSTPTIAPTSPSPSPSPVVSPSPTPSLPPVKVPHVNGDRPEEALRKLREKGLVGQIKEEADCKANGRVLSTSPQRDETVPRGTMVTVFISSAGENPVAVPSLTNRPLNEVEQELRSLGLRPDVRRRQETNSVQENTVLGQNPQAYSRLKSGCPVELTVSIRVQLIEVPSYIGLSQRDAFQRLPRYIGQLVRGRVTEIDSDRPSGTVIDQSPKAGEMVHPGTAVDLVISRSTPAGIFTAPPGRGSPPVVVPDLRGMTQEQATSVIARTQGRLRLGQVNKKRVYDPKQAGKVDDQTPKPFQRVSPGTRIDIVTTYYYVDPIR